MRPTVASLLPLQSIRSPRMRRFISNGSTKNNLSYSSAADEIIIMETQRKSSHHSLVVDEPHDDVEALQGDNEQQQRTLQPTPYFQSVDFKELVVCCGFFVCCMIPFMIPSTPNQRPIPYQLLSSGEYVLNLTYNEDADKDTVSDVLLVFLAVVIPLVVQFGLAKYYCAVVGDAHATICVYLVAFGITLLTTNLVKLYVGYFRPGFYELCQPNNDYSACSNDEGNGETTRKSFPSGHASTSFCGLTLLTLFLHQHFGVPSLSSQSNNNSANQPQKKAFKCRIISVVCLAPMALAVFIAASRVHDNKHFPADVVGGSLLGASVAIYVHGLWWF